MLEYRITRRGASQLPTARKPPWLPAPGMSLPRTSSPTRKLVSIRHRTDHDLLVLVSRELDRGVALVDVATTRTSPLFAQAQKAYDTARAILPRIADLSEGDRLHLESRLKELRGSARSGGDVCEGGAV